MSKNKLTEQEFEKIITNRLLFQEKYLIKFVKDYLLFENSLKDSNMDNIEKLGE